MADEATIASYAARVVHARTVDVLVQRILVEEFPVAVQADGHGAEERDSGMVAFVKSE